MAVYLRRVSDLRRSRAGDGWVGEGDDAGDDVAELSGEAVVKALFARPYVLASLADGAVRGTRARTATTLSRLRGENMSGSSDSGSRRNAVSLTASSLAATRARGGDDDDPQNEKPDRDPEEDPHTLGRA